jgi:hypothetical protein
MQDRIKAPIGENPREFRAIRQRCMHQSRSRRHASAVALAQVIQHHNLITAIKQSQHRMAANETRTACHQITRHVLFLPYSFKAGAMPLPAFDCAVRPARGDRRHQGRKHPGA